ncbi:glycosyltransferase [Halostagnicola kamekurae]|uniref:Rhamnosyl/mannosyltransferase n=1 Tax=Halostagnicola kamekurae TaxID=619731 RepID=A0A1I6PM50_9EURY|nr:glycosyltransferase [Halostagnicola kamekurae]SFS41272.1 rhamnosyl/mannosyltransferase [Halostagnicola kamekurae]
MSPNTATDDAVNVLQVCTYYYPFTGGIQNVVESLVTGIDSVRFRILASQPRGRPSVDEVDGTTVVRAGSLGAVASTPISPTFPYLLRKQLEWADVVHYHLPFPLGPVSHLLNRAAVPVVVTFHDDIIDKEPFVYPYNRVLDRFLRGVDTIIVSSPNMRDECARISKFSAKTTVIPLGIDVDETSVEPRTREGTRLLFVGRLVEFKGVEYLISAMRNLDASLSIVGKGPARESLERHAEAEGVSQKVTFEGFVSDERLEQLYRDADVFVLPSAGENESFGIVQLEAMSHGLPVINTALPTGVPFVSVDGETGLTVDPGEPDQIADAARTLFEDDNRYRRYSANAQRRVISKFDEQEMLEQTADVYRDVLERA